MLRSYRCSSRGPPRSGSYGACAHVAWPTAAAITTDKNQTSPCSCKSAAEVQWEGLGCGARIGIYRPRGASSRLTHAPPAQAADVPSPVPLSSVHSRTFAAAGAPGPPCGNGDRTAAEQPGLQPGPRIPGRGWGVGRVQAAMGMNRPRFLSP